MRIIRNHVERSLIAFHLGLYCSLRVNFVHETIKCAARFVVAGQSKMLFCVCMCVFFFVGSVLLLSSSWNVFFAVSGHWPLSLHSVKPKRKTKMSRKKQVISVLCFNRNLLPHTNVDDDAFQVRGSKFETSLHCVHILCLDWTV